MSFDLYLAPPNGFLDWGDARWAAFFEQEPPPEYRQLGNSISVALALEVIAHNLEQDKAGARFPLLDRLRTADVIGWYAPEVPALAQETTAIKAGLSSLPINRDTLQYQDEADVARRIADFRRYHRNRELKTLYDLHFWFVDTLEQMAKAAIDNGAGLFVSY